MAARLAAGALALFCALPPAEAATIHWHVENPFRLFLDPRDTARHRVALAALRADERAAPVLAVERRLAEEAPRGWAEDVYTRTCWSATRQRYHCDAHADYAHPASHRVVASLAAVGGIGRATCTWTMSEPAGSAAAVARWIAPCAEAQLVDVPYPKGVRLDVTSDDGRVASALVRIEDVLIVGIGDSFASGDGNPDAAVRFEDRRALAYKGPAPEPLDGYPARAGAWISGKEAEFERHGSGWLSSACHRSLYGHHLRAALQLALEDPHRAVTFASFACWGAGIVDGVLLSPRPTDVVPDFPTTAQLEDVARLQCGRHATEVRRWPRAFDQGGRLAALTDLQLAQCPPAQARRIDLLLVSVGGNDIGFAQMVANAVLSDATPLRKIGGWLGHIIDARQALDALSGLDDRFKALNRAAHVVLHIPWGEAERIILTAYPPIALDDGGEDVCPGGRSGMTVLPEFALDRRRTRDGERVAARLHATMQRIARQHGWTFVDAHRAAFAGHGLCAGAARGLASPADDGRLPRLVDGDWRPYPPSQWQPYASRRRWIRTPNDAYLTVNFHVGRLGLVPANLLLASSYSGAFHPTAEGQAAMADALVVAARRVLARHAASPRTR